MKYIKIISLSLIIFICCLSPVISAEATEDGSNNTDLNDTDDFSRRYAHIEIFFVDNENKTYSQGDDIFFGISYANNFYGPLEIYLDGDYITTVDPTPAQIFIKLFNYQLSTGQHCIKCHFGGDDTFYSEDVSEYFYVEWISVLLHFLFFYF